MNDEKIKQILNEIGRTEVPPNAALLAERASRDFSAVLKIQQPRQWFISPVRLIAAAAVIIFAFAAGRWSTQMSSVSRLPKIAAYTQAASIYPAASKNSDSFWRQKALTAMRPGPYAQTQFSQTDLLNRYKQYLKEKHYE
jgi:hypothetical protein